MAAVAFFVVAGTGLVRAVEAVTSWEELTATTYGRLVVAKAVLFAAAAICAALNRWRSVPAAPRTLGPFRLTSALELTALVGATLAAATLTASAPPVGGTAGVRPDGRRSTTSRRPCMRDWRLSPTSPVRIASSCGSRITTRGRRSRPTASASRFTALDDPGVAPTSLALAAGPGDTYAGSGANMSFDGRWQVVVLVERAGGSVEIPLELETQVAPRMVTVQRPDGPVAVVHRGSPPRRGHPVLGRPRTSRSGQAADRVLRLHRRPAHRRLDDRDDCVARGGRPDPPGTCCKPSREADSSPT